MSFTSKLYTLTTKINTGLVSVGEKHYLLYLFFFIPVYTLLILTIAFVCSIVAACALLLCVAVKKYRPSKSDLKSLWHAFKDIFAHDWSPYRYWLPSQYRTWRSRAMLGALQQ